MQRNVVIQRKRAVLSRVDIATNSRTKATTRVTSGYVQRTSQGSRLITVDLLPYGIRTRVAYEPPQEQTGLFTRMAKRLLSWLGAR